METEGSNRGREAKAGVVDKNRQDASQTNVLCIPPLRSWFQQLAIKICWGQDRIFKYALDSVR